MQEEPILEFRAHTDVFKVSEQVRRASICSAVCSSAGRRGIEECTIFSYAVARTPDLVNLIRSRQHVIALGIQSADRGEQSGTLFLCELGAERVNGDVDGTTVSFEGENARHDLGSWAANRLAERVEVFEIGFVERVADDLNVEVVEFGCGEAFTEEICCSSTGRVS